MGELVEIAQNRSGASEHLTNILNRARYESIIERAYAERPEIGGFDFAIHSDAIRRFIERDRDSLIDNRVRVVSAHHAGLPQAGAGGEVAILRREFEKKRRRMPIRRLMQRAGKRRSGRQARVYDEPAVHRQLRPARLAEVRRGGFRRGEPSEAGGRARPP